VLLEVRDERRQQPDRQYGNDGADLQEDYAFVETLVGETPP